MKKIVSKRVFKYRNKILVNPNINFSPKNVLKYYEILYSELSSYSVNLGIVEGEDIVYTLSNLLILDLINFQISKHYIV